VYTSKNHWSNELIKMDQYRALFAYRAELIKTLVASGIMAQAYADKLVMVLVLDCWPVNLKADLKAWIASEFNSGPHGRIVVTRFIPAGITGEGQLGDTDFQVPFHRSYEASFQAYYQVENMRLLGELETGEIGLDEFEASIRALTSMPVLRELSIVWVGQACQHVVDAGVLKAAL
jgi:hypothetical protein